MDNGDLNGSAGVLAVTSTALNKVETLVELIIFIFCSYYLTVKDSWSSIPLFPSVSIAGR